MDTWRQMGEICILYIEGDSVRAFEATAGPPIWLTMLPDHHHPKAFDRTLVGAYYSQSAHVSWRKWITSDSLCQR